MYKLLRMAVFALPFAGGAAWAQAAGTSGSAGAPGSAMTPPVTDDTRTPLQQRAGRLDDTAPALPGDATKPVDIPNRVEERSTTPDTTDMNTPGSGATDKKVHKRRSSSKVEEKSTTRSMSDDTSTKLNDDSATKPNDNDTSTKIQDKSLNDSQRDQLDSDK